MGSSLLLAFTDPDLPRERLNSRVLLFPEAHAPQAWSQFNSVSFSTLVFFVPHPQTALSIHYCPGRADFMPFGEVEVPAVTVETEDLRSRLLTVAQFITENVYVKGTVRKISLY